jgi:Helix-turn-helix domain
MSSKQGEAGMTDLVVRRRGGLMGLVAVCSLALSAGYLWQFGQDGDGVALVVGVVLGLVAILHGLAWGDARTPLLVADETGLRVRLGGDWTGVPWSHVERVEVDDRGRIRDGHVAVMAAEGADELANARWRPRLGAALNRWFYDASLVVPYGLTTIVSSADVPAALDRLAAGRAPIVRLDAEIEEPEPTVALTTPETATPPSTEVSAPVVDEPAVTSEPTWTPEPGSAPPAAEEPSRPSRKPRIPLIAARDGSPALPLAKVVAALRSHPARREEVTLPLSSEHATHGTLALSSPYPDEATEPLPEIQHLRRREDVIPPAPVHDEPISNVGLIIDATTDLSARAMSKVRRAAPLAASTEITRDADRRTPDEPEADAADLVIGGIVGDARVRLRLTVDELAERTRIRPYVIESIEVDDFAPCGGDFYARGHLRMLARVLGLDSDELLTTYDDNFAASPINPRAVFDAELATGATGMMRGGASGANWGGLIAAVLVLVLIWGVAKYFADSTELPGTQAPPTQNAAGLGSPGPGNAKQPPPAAEPTQASVRLTAVGGDSRVVVKNRRGDVVFQGVLADGQAHLSRGLAPLHVMAVDGGVVRLGAPGHKPALMGEPGARSRQAVAASAAD